MSCKSIKIINLAHDFSQNQNSCLKWKYSLKVHVNFLCFLRKQSLCCIRSGPCKDTAGVKGLDRAQALAHSSAPGGPLSLAGNYIGKPVPFYDEGATPARSPSKASSGMNPSPGPKFEGHGPINSLTDAILTKCRPILASSGSHNHHSLYNNSWKSAAAAAATTKGHHHLGVEGEKLNHHCYLHVEGGKPNNHHDRHYRHHHRKFSLSLITQTIPRYQRKFLCTTTLM